MRKHINMNQFAADGYDPATNTVYMFYDVSEHGCPDIYYPDDTNKKYGVTYDQLYTERYIADRILDAGYNLVTMWEHIWELQKNNKVIKPQIERYLRSQRKKLTL